jgi:hypothetical protein
MVKISTLQTQPAERLHVNDIGEVEFETVSPLFFDSYRNNRTTGSFIIIDPLTNATLGAGMIEEDLSLQASEARVAQGLETPVSARERYSRNGHFPGIILTYPQPGMAVPLERALFERGFEVFVIAAQPGDPAASAAVITLHAAGFVVLCEDHGLREKKQALRAAAGGRFFDLGETPCATPAEAMQQVLAFAESLRISINRIPGDDGNPRKAL